MRAMNSRVGVNMKYLGAVGWQPTALIGNNAGYEQQGWDQHDSFWAVGWQPTALIGNNAGYEQQGWGST